MAWFSAWLAAMRLSIVGLVVESGLWREEVYIYLYRMTSYSKVRVERRVEGEFSG